MLTLFKPLKHLDQVAPKSAMCQANHAESNQSLFVAHASGCFDKFGSSALNCLDRLDMM